ncbi:hypothetical protein LA76x_2997 [Lysobacter antibioticus]|uniref:Uncharacterized protein n=1 Tax=Lysobacter antibioticus TaxID=84531 RepID=A0A0S2FC68_LYSAN|nr:hypothetical protein LA76x_2997 [Lysobacter antibioticus]
MLELGVDSVHGASSEFRRVRSESKPKSSRTMGEIPQRRRVAALAYCSLLRTRSSLQTGVGTWRRFGSLGEQ